MADQHRLQPPAVLHLRRRQPRAPSAALRLGQIRERALLDFQRAKLLHQLRAHHRREPVAGPRGVDQLVALVVSEDERVERLRSRPCSRRSRTPGLGSRASSARNPTAGPARSDCRGASRRGPPAFAPSRRRDPRRARELRQELLIRLAHLVWAPLAREAEAPGRFWIGSRKELADGRVTSEGDVATATLARDTAARLCLPHDRHGVRSARVVWRACNRKGRHRLAAHTAEGDGDVVVCTRR